MSKDPRAVLFLAQRYWFGVVFCFFFVYVNGNVTLGPYWKTRYFMRSITSQVFGESEGYSKFISWLFCISLRFISGCEHLDFAVNTFI
jgi:hypothetical protein